MLEDVLVCDVCTQNYLRYWGINLNELSKKYIFVLFFKFEIILKLKKKIEINLKVIPFENPEPLFKKQQKRKNEGPRKEI